MLAVGVLVAGALAVGVLFVRGWVLVAPGEPFPDGPVAVLGGAGGRVQAAVALVERSGEPRLLVLSSSAADLYRNAGGSCDEPGVRCVMPDPETTAGEARLLARLAREEGWEQLTVVTTDTHATRARMHLAACMEVPTEVVAVPTGWSVDRLRLVVREAAGTAWQWATGRC
ncbi:MAG: YdcF family protein [Nitriliruptoraceae bacterium]